MPRMISNLMTSGTADLTAGSADFKRTSALSGNTGFGSYLSRAMGKNATSDEDQDVQADAGGAQSNGSLDLATLLSTLLQKKETSSGQTDEKAGSVQTEATAAWVAQSDFSLLMQTTAGKTAGGAQSNGSLDLATLLSTLLGQKETSSEQTTEAVASSDATPATAYEGTVSMESLLLEKEKILSQQAAAGKSSGTSANQTENKGKTNSAANKTDQELQDLVAGLLALAMLKDAGANTRTSAESSVSGNSLDASLAGAEDSAVSASSQGKTSSSNDSSTGLSQMNNQDLLSSLAVLLFSGLETATGVQGTAATEDGGQSVAARLADSSAERQINAESVRQSNLRQEQTTGALSPAEVQSLAARLFNAGKEVSAGSEKAARAQAALTPAAQPAAGDQTLTVTVIGGNGAHAYREGMGPTTEDGGANTTRDGQANAASAVVADLTPLLKSQDTDKGASGVAGKEKFSSRQTWPVGVDANATVADRTSQPQEGSSMNNSAAAIERFDKALEQVGNRMGANDLTVRLTVGSEGSLVLGLKDLGSSVTVEVKASNQGMIDLLQSQRDAIIGRLESKDIYADLVIDPNASGTPERRERRGTEERTSGSRKQTNDSFRTFLEAIA